MTFFIQCIDFELHYLVDVNQDGYQWTSTMSMATRYDEPTAEFIIRDINRECIHTVMTPCDFIFT